MPIPEIAVGEMRMPAMGITRLLDKPDFAARVETPAPMLLIDKASKHDSENEIGMVISRSRDAKEIGCESLTSFPRETASAYS